MEPLITEIPLMPKNYSVGYICTLDEVYDQKNNYPPDTLSAIPVTLSSVPDTLQVSSPLLIHLTLSVLHRTLSALHLTPYK